MNNQVPTQSETIDSLLARRCVERIERGSSPYEARENLEVAKYIAQHLEAFDRLRLSIVHPDQHHLNRHDDDVIAVGQWLTARRFLVRKANGTGFALPQLEHAQLQSYFKGLWLEAYVWSAFIEAGADEAYYGQKVKWTVDDVSGTNEMDVIARKGKQLVFVSCKAISPAPENGRATELREYLFEAHYWNLHFASGQAKAVVATTADLVNETKHGDWERFPPLGKQADILDTTLLGAEDLRWDTLVEAAADLMTDPR